MGFKRIPYHTEWRRVSIRLEGEISLSASLPQVGDNRQPKGVKFPVVCLGGGDRLKV